MTSPLFPINQPERAYLLGWFVSDFDTTTSSVVRQPLDTNVSDIANRNKSLIQSLQFVKSVCSAFFETNIVYYNFSLILSPYPLTYHTILHPLIVDGQNHIAINDDIFPSKDLAWVFMRGYFDNSGSFKRSIIDNKPL